MGLRTHSTKQIGQCYLGSLGSLLCVPFCVFIVISTDASNPKALRETVTRRGAGVGSALRGPCILVMTSGKGLPYPPWKEERGTGFIF